MYRKPRTKTQSTPTSVNNVWPEKNVSWGSCRWRSASKRSDVFYTKRSRAHNARFGSIWNAWISSFEEFHTSPNNRIWDETRTPEIRNSLRPKVNKKIEQIHVGKKKKRRPWRGRTGHLIMLYVCCRLFEKKTYFPQQRYNFQNNCSVFAKVRF